MAIHSVHSTTARHINENVKEHKSITYLNNMDGEEPIGASGQQQRRRTARKIRSVMSYICEVFVVV
jgi:hypothetical protein